MPLEISIYNGICNQESREKERLLLKTTEKVLKEEKIEEGEISLALVSDEEIKRLNNEYRGKNTVTDVLSFPLDEEMIGEVIISWTRANAQAKEYGHTLNRELGFLLVHGLLHLLGYDHETEKNEREMRKKQEEILGFFDLGREEE